MFQPIATEYTDSPDYSPSVSSDDTLGIHTEGSVNVLLKVTDDEGEKSNGSKKILSGSDSGDDTDEGV